MRLFKIKNINRYLFSLISLISMVSFMYPDIIITAGHSYYIYSKGNFYKNALDALIYKNNHIPAVYELPIYIIFAIWNLPLRIISLLIGKDVFGFYASNSTNSSLLFKLLWAKLFVILFLVLSAYVVYKICLELGMSNRKSKNTVFMFLFSIFTFFPVLIHSQYDIIPLFFMLMGIFYFMKNKIILFIVYFSIALVMKTYAIFIFIPLLLLYEKNIKKIFMNILLVSSLLVILKLYLKGDYYYHISQKDFTIGMMNRLFTSNIISSNGHISIFIIILFFVCCFSYLKVLEKDEMKILSIYIPLIVFMGFFSFVPYNLQWIILLSPFISIMISINYTKTNKILEALLSFSAFMTIILYCNEIILFIESYYLPKIYRANGVQKFQSIYQIVEGIFKNSVILGHVPDLLSTIFVGSSIVFLILNFPQKKWSINNIEKTEITEKDNLIRLSIPTVLVVLFLFCYYYSG